MTKGEAVNWLINLMSDIGKIEHQELWHYEQALAEIRDMLEDEARNKKPYRNPWLVPTTPYYAIGFEWRAKDE